MSKPLRAERVNSVAYSKGIEVGNSTTILFYHSLKSLGKEVKDG